MPKLRHLRKPKELTKTYQKEQTEWNQGRFNKIRNLVKDNHHNHNRQ